MNYLPAILQITNADIALQMGATRQAVSQGSASVKIATGELIEVAKRDPGKVRRARAALAELEDFLKNVPPSLY